MSLPKKIIRPVALALVPLFLNACAAYKLSDQNPQFLVAKSKTATQGLCAVTPFSYEPVDQDDKSLMSDKDLQRWNDIFYDSVNLSHICARTIKVPATVSIPASVNYVISGKVTNFYFKKNWVPMFFPGWMTLTVFTLGIYAIAAGPTTSTKVNFGFTTTLKDPSTGKIIDSIPESFESTDVMTMYSDTNTNPYHNTGMAFDPTLNDLTKKLGDRIAETENQKRSGSKNDVAIRQLESLREAGVLSDKEYAQKINQLTQ